MERLRGKTDSYNAFASNNIEGNLRRLVSMLRLHIDDPEKSNPFWEKFKEALDQGNDESNECSHYPLLVHGYINTIRELFEEYDDNEALALLDKIEVECC